MTATMSELSPDSRSRSDRERFVNILAVQRAAYLREGAPSLTKRSRSNRLRESGLSSDVVAVIGVPPIAARP